MRTTLVCLAWATLTLAAGCAGTGGMKDEAVQQVTCTGAGKDMTLTIRVPKRDWTVGEVIGVEVTAVNTTGSPADIVSPSGAPVLVRVMRPSRGSFEQVRVYPSSATSNIVNWTLPARGARTYKLMVPVEPDWPVAEPLRLSAELNGYPRCSPAVTISVRPQE